MSVFAPDPVVLKALWFMLAVEGRYVRLSWSQGADLAPLDLREPRSESEVLQRLVAEFDAEIMLPRAVPVLEADDVAPALVSFDFGLDDMPGFLQLAERMCEDRDVLVSAGTRRRLGFGVVDEAAVVWARVEGREGVGNLMRFRPSPTLIVREGLSSRMVALWSLSRPLRYSHLVQANRRIAHKLWGPKKWCEAEFVFPCPGSCLRVGRSRPVPVHVESFDPMAVYSAREVVGNLRDAPSPTAWREAA